MSRGQAFLVLASKNSECWSFLPISMTIQVPTAMIDEIDSQPGLEQTAPTTQLASSDDEAVLFRHFPGFLYSERTRERSGWVWDYGYDISKTTAQKVERRWVCKRCIQIRSSKVRGLAEKGTDNMMNHLFLEHGQCAPEGKTRGSAQKAADKKANKNPTGLPQKIQRTIAEAFQIDTEDPKEQRVANIFIKSFDRQHFQRLVVEWIIHGNRPFTEPECPRLRAIFEYLNPSVALRKAYISDSTVRTHIIQEYKKNLERVIEILQKCPGLIHISFDGWTARNKLPLYGVAVFFRNEYSKLMKLVLGVPEVDEIHSGENIGATVDQVCTYCKCNGYEVLVTIVLNIVTKSGNLDLDSTDLQDSKREGRLLCY